MVQYALDYLLLNKKTIKTTLPAQGIVTLAKQRNRYIAHMLYGVPVRRGMNTEVIEDIQPLYQIEAQLNINELIKKPVKRVYLAPQNTDIEYSIENEAVHINIPRIDIHQMIVFDY
jgi:hypothetical protein